jgi:hypothetical protein
MSRKIWRGLVILPVVAATVFRQDDILKGHPQGFARHPEQHSRVGKARFQVKVVTVQGDTAVSVRGPREQALRERAGQLIWGVDAAFRLPQDLNRNRRPPPILQEPLMRRGVVGLDERLMALLELRRRAGEGELIVVEAPLDVKVGLVRSVGSKRALTLRQAARRQPCNSVSMRVEVPPSGCRSDSISPRSATGPQRPEAGVNGGAWKPQSGYPV